MKNFAREYDRYKVSIKAVAKIGNGLLNDLKLVTKTTGQNSFVQESSEGSDLSGVGSLKKNKVLKSTLGGYIVMVRNVRLL